MILSDRKEIQRPLDKVDELGELFILKVISLAFNVPQLVPFGHFSIHLGRNRAVVHLVEKVFCYFWGTEQVLFECNRVELYLLVLRLSQSHYKVKHFFSYVGGVEISKVCGEIISAKSYWLRIYKLINRAGHMFLQVFLAVCLILSSQLYGESFDIFQYRKACTVVQCPTDSAKVLDLIVV